MVRRILVEFLVMIVMFGRFLFFSYPIQLGQCGQIFCIGAVGHPHWSSSHTRPTGPLPGISGPISIICKAYNTLITFLIPLQSGRLRWAPIHRHFRYQTFSLPLQPSLFSFFPTRLRPVLLPGNLISLFNFKVVIFLSNHKLGFV